MRHPMLNRVFNGFVLIFLIVNLVGTPTLATAGPARAPEQQAELLVDGSAMTGVNTLLSSLVKQGRTSVSADGNFVAFERMGLFYSQIAVYNRDTDETTCVSVSPEGILGNNSSFGPSLSADGRYVVFSSLADNLVQGDTNQVWDVFVHDMYTNVTKRVSVTSGGAEVGGRSRSASISANGRYVAFQSDARDLLPYPATENGYYYYVHNLETGRTEFIYTPPTTYSGPPVPISSNGRYMIVFSNELFRILDRQTGERTDLPGGVDASISSDGRFVAFSYDDQVFVYDVQTGENTQVSVSSEGVAANDWSFYPTISANGRYVVFHSGANNLVPDYSEYNMPNHIYLHDRYTGETVPVSISLDGSLDTSYGSDHGSERSAISPDGRTVVFISRAQNLVEGFSDNGSERGLYAYDLQQKPPVIVVHGWQGLNLEGGYSCDEDIQPYDGTNTTLMPDPSLDNYSHLAEWLEEDGYDVWIAHIDSGPLGTPALEKNVKCLTNQIRKVWDANPQPISMIAHSMGGLVSRGAIRMLEPEIDIKSLYTLGSPHAGVIINFRKIDLCWVEPAGCQMMPDGVVAYNEENPNIANVQYHFFGGDGGGLEVFGRGPTDGFVGQYSAVGWVYPDQLFSPDNWTARSSPGQYFTNESHPTTEANAAWALYVAPDGEYSQSYSCVRDLLMGSTGTQSCLNIRVQEMQPASDATPGESFGFTKNYAGHLESGQGTSFSIDIDGSSEVVFYLNWFGDSAPVFTLISPEMVEITPQYAIENPGIVSYEISSGAGQFLPYQTYQFPAGEVGTWQVNLSAASDEIDYQVFAALDSARTFVAELDQYTYQIGETANITTSLSSNGVGLSGATVIASITSSDGTETQLTLTDNLDGTYVGSYLIPDAPGYLTLTLAASGEDNGVAYTRSANLVAAIAPNDLTLTGEYTEEPLDDDNSLLYEKLAFDLGVDLAEPGSYAVSAELYAGDELITHAGDFFDLEAGTQTIRLLFDGQAIRDSGLDGPYTITNLFLTPLDLGITAQEADGVLQTAPYRHTQFGLSAPPAEFGKASPSDGAIGQSTSLTLSWANSDGAISYEYCLDTIDNAECDTSWESTDNVTQIALDDLSAGTTYFWQVRADNFEGITYANDGVWWSFATALDVPTLSCPAGGVIYVNQGASGNNEGSSWQNAFKDLQTPLTRLDGPCKIWVAAGTYIPHISNRTVSFQLKNGVEIYGGFAGTETDIHQRDFETNLTILSGDLLGNDNENITRDEPTRAENSYHVLVASGTDDSPVLDGLTVTGGNANGGGSPDTCSGAGIYSDSGSPVLANLIFSANSACDGGGVANYNGSNPTLENVSFNSNFADNGGGMANQSGSSPALKNVSFNSNSANHGGGMANYNGSSPTLENVSFNSNFAGIGGGMANQSSTPTLENVSFNSNAAEHYGGGMSNENNSSSVLINVTFSANSAVHDGGGMYNLGSSPTLNYVIFSGNTAGNAGGGMLINLASSPTLTDVVFEFNSASLGGGMTIGTDSGPNLTNVTFHANSADYGGGMNNSWNSSPTLTNVTFSANSAIEGGGMRNRRTSSPVLTNVTFSGNSADLGGGMINLDDSRLTLKNVIVANSISGGDCVNNSSSALNTASGHNLIEDNVSACGLINGVSGNIIGQYPLLGILQDNGGFTQTHALLYGSPAINAGTNTGCPATDQRGIERPQGTSCDIGAYEYVPAVITKSAPANSATGQSLSTTLSWGVHDGATSYEYCYSSVAGPCTQWNSVGTNTSVTLNDLAADYTYYWQVRAININGTTEADGGSWWSFTTTSVSACTWPTYTPPTSATFSDVPMTAGHWSWVERLANSTISAGCGNGNFCPFSEVVRAQMAIFLLRSKHCGSSYAPPPVGDSTGFTDVPLNASYAPWVKQLAAEGISTGCGGGNFCPQTVVNRAQMAIFLLRAKHGATYSPPAVGASTGFGDVPVSASYAPWVKQLVAEGVTSGCGGGNFCPLQNVNRAQLATFLVRTFNLP